MNKSRVIRFSLPVACHIPFSSEIREYEDCGVIILPDSYSQGGAPTRMVINCHGAGGTVSTDDSQTEGQAITQYLVANGYAVMGVNGLPHRFAGEYGIDIRNNVGSALSVECNVKAYRLCMERFNLLPEVIVFGASMGGISGTNLVLSGRIPVLAQAGFCPVLDTYNEIFLHPWSDGLPKTALARLCSFEKDGRGEWIYDEAKVAGYNPAANPKRLNYPCPLHFSQCMDDPIVSHEITRRFVDEICASGGSAELLSLPTGGHEPQLYGEPVSEPSGVTVLDGEALLIRPAVEAAFRFMRRFG